MSDKVTSKELLKLIVIRRARIEKGGEWVYWYEYAGNGEYTRISKPVSRSVFQEFGHEGLIEKDPNGDYRVSQKAVDGYYANH